MYPISCGKKKCDSSLLKTTRQQSVSVSMLLDQVNTSDEHLEAHLCTPCFSQYVVQSSTGFLDTVSLSV